MWYNDHVKNYGDNCYKINKVYCQKYGYDLIKSSHRFYKDRNPHWEKFPMILNHINNYDYVVWIDADAFFYNISPPIKNLINKYKKDILFSADRDKSNPPPVNSGVLILRNTQAVVDIVKKWAYSKELKDKYCGNRFIDGYLCPRMNWVEDQSMVRGFVKDNVDNINNISKLMPYLELQHYYKAEKKYLKEVKNKPYIFHLAGRHEDRFIESKKYLDLLRELGHNI